MKILPITKSQNINKDIIKDPLKLLAKSFKKNFPSEHVVLRNPQKLMTREQLNNGMKKAYEKLFKSLNNV